MAELSTAELVASKRARWQTRRRMAKLAFAMLCLLPLLVLGGVMLDLIDASEVNALSGLLIAVISALAAIISVYITSATYDDKHNQQG